MNIKKRLSLLKSSAKKRNISVKLNTKFYENLIYHGCVYCGEKLTDKGGYCLDRMDNDLGYTNENVTPCCSICNRAKGTMSVNDFINWTEKAYKFQQKQLALLNPDKRKREKEIRKEENIYFNKSAVKTAKVISIDGKR